MIPTYWPQMHQPPDFGGVENEPGKRGQVTFGVGFSDGCPGNGGSFGVTPVRHT
jgi:hypothetical protein